MIQITTKNLSLKHKFYFLLFFICLANQVQSQDLQTGKDSSRIHYTIVHNIVPENFGFPLIGLVNTANGNQRHVQAGLVNVTTGHLSGLQFGALNVCLKSFSGLQAGLFNLTKIQDKGFRIGFLNNTLQNAKGGQFGTVNAVGGDYEGVQTGMFNSIGNRLTGIQLGLFNKASLTDNALQIGLVNWADSSSNSLSIALIPFIRKGGYRAIEIGVSEFYPIHSSLKLGSRRFFSSISLLVDPTEDNAAAYAIGMGFGKKFRGWELQPEIQTIRDLSGEYVPINQFMMNFLVDLPAKFQLMLSPSLSLQALDGEQRIKDSWLSIYSFEKDDYRAQIGVRAGIRYRL